MKLTKTFELCVSDKFWAVVFLGLACYLYYFPGESIRPIDAIILSYLSMLSHDVNNKEAH